MEIRGIGGDPGPNWGQNWNLPLAGKHVQQLLDSDLVATALAQLATHEVVATLGEIEDRRLSVRPEVAAPAMREIAAAIAQGNVSDALARVNALVRGMPGIVEALRKDPSLEPIRTQVEALLRGIAAERRQVLEPALARAAELVESRGPLPLGNDGTDTRAMIAVAMRFIETGRIQDLVRAEELVGVVMKRYRPGVAAAGAGAAGGGTEPNWVQRTADWLGRVWGRAPLLILLVTWLALGAMGMVNVTLWVVGLLALVGLGFYSGIRNVRF